MKDLLIKLLAWFKKIDYESEEDAIERQKYGGP